MPLPDPNIFGPATLSVTQGITAFSSFLPRLSEVRKASISSDPDIAGDVRMGEVAATTITLGMGLIASSLTGSTVPVVASVLMSTVLICIYESALRMDKPLNPKGAGFDTTYERLNNARSAN
jgi:hypothetical protein